MIESPKKSSARLSRAILTHARKGNLQSLLDAIAAGAPVDATDPKSFDGKTPATEAIINGHLECLRALLDAGCDPNLARTDGATPASCAVYTNRVDCLALLLASGARLTFETGHGSSLILLAAVSGSLDCLRLLIEAGAPMNETDSFGFTAAQRAGIHDKPDCLHLLQTSGCSIAFDPAESDRAISFSLERNIPSVENLLAPVRAQAASLLEYQAISRELPEALYAPAASARL